MNCFFYLFCSIPVTLLLRVVLLLSQSMSLDRAVDLTSCNSSEVDGKDGRKGGQQS